MQSVYAGKGRRFALVSCAGLFLVSCGKPQVENIQESPKAATQSAALKGTQNSSGSHNVVGSEVSVPTTQRDSSGDDHDVTVVRKKTP